MTTVLDFNCRTARSLDKKISQPLVRAAKEYMNVPLESGDHCLTVAAT